MKKYYLGIMVVALMFVFGPSSADAASISEIQQLMARLSERLNLLINPQSELSSAGTTSTSSVYMRNLAFGSEGSDVTALQNFLVAEGYDTSVTGYFGVKTKLALGAYQKSKNIVPPNGFFGIITRTAVIADTQALELSTATTTNTTSTATTTSSTLTTSAEITASSTSQTILQGSPAILKKFEVNDERVTLFGEKFSKNSKVYVNNVQKGELTLFGDQMGYFPLPWLPEVNSSCDGGNVRIEGEENGLSNTLWIGNGCDTELVGTVVSTSTPPTGEKYCYINVPFFGRENWDRAECLSDRYTMWPENMKKEKYGNSEEEELGMIDASIQVIKDLLKSL